ncbi:MAG: PAS domain-containing protein [Betaproteobacteria bacterium]|nr:PAS domain-containing protein [Betaproteobacteria bacterium]
MAKGEQRARKALPRARQHPAVPSPVGSERLERLELVMHAINEGVYDWDVANGKIHYSEGVYSVLHLPRSVKTPMDWRARIHPEDLGAYDEAILAHFRNETERFECDYRYRARYGAWRWARQHGIAQRDAHGRVIRMIGSTGDITELKRVAQALKESQERLALATQAATEGIYEWNVETGSLYLSERAKAFFAISGKRLTPAAWNAHVHREDFAAYRAAIASLFKSRRSEFEHEYRIRKAGGELSWILDRAVVVRDAAGRVTRLVGAVADITQRKLDEIELRRARDEATAALERQTATAEVLASISGSMADTQPVFERIVQNVRRLFGTRFAVLQLLHGDMVEMPAVDGQGIEKLREHYPRPLDATTVGGLAMLSEAGCAVRARSGQPGNAAGRHRVCPRRRLQFGDLHADDPRGQGDRGDRRRASRGRALRRPAGRAHQDLRRPGRDRDREHAPVQRDEGSARAADGDGGDPEGYLQFAGGRAARFRRDRELRKSADRGILDGGAACFRRCAASGGVYEYERVRRRGSEERVPHGGFQPECHHRGGSYRSACLRNRYRSSSRSRIPLARGGSRARLSKHAVYAAASGRSRDRHDQCYPPGAGGVRQSQGRTAQNLRRPGGDRDRERAPVQRDPRGAGAADRDRGSAARHRRLDHRHPAGVRHYRQRAARLTGAEYGWVFRFDREWIHVASAFGINTQGMDAARKAFPMRPGGGSLSARAVREGRVVNVADVLAESDSGDTVRHLAREAGYRSVLCVPMIREQQTVGVITVNRAAVGTFAEKEVDLLRTFADQAVIAIENVRLFNETREGLSGRRRRRRS